MSITTPSSSKDWIIELGVRPHQMSLAGPPEASDDDDEYARLLLSVCAMTLAEHFVPRRLDSYLLEHIELERQCSEQEDLQLVWSDDVSLTLCFLASLAHHGDYSQEHLLQRYFQWWMNG